MFYVNKSINYISYCGQFQVMVTAAATAAATADIKLLDSHVLT